MKRLLLIPFVVMALAALAGAGDPRPTNWPKGLEWPAGMESYQSSKYTQSVQAIAGGGDVTYRIPRESLEEKYRVNGGMVGVRGFRSDLYRNARVKEGVVWVAKKRVKNSFGFFQAHDGFHVQFPDGSKLLDVLTNTATEEVFEVRQREKDRGKWSYATVYENEKARPRGYTGVKQSCVSCHKNAGGGDGSEDANYSDGLPPGGDQTFSVGLAPLERNTHRLQTLRKPYLVYEP